MTDLFDGQTQLIVYRAFFEPGVENWPDAGCSGCAMFIDNLGHLAHLNVRDTSFVVLSPAPIEAIARYKAGIGRKFPWFTTVDDFSRDFDVDEYFGVNVFVRGDDRIYRTYFTNGHATDAIGNVWSLLDITPLGRQEEWEDSPRRLPAWFAVLLVAAARRADQELVDAGRVAGPNVAPVPIERRLCA